MWRIVERNLPIGIQFEGSTDWVCLHWTFVNYLINSDDENLTYLKSFYQYSMSASEVVLKPKFSF